MLNVNIGDEVGEGEEEKGNMEFVLSELKVLKARVEALEKEKEKEKDSFSNSIELKFRG